MPIARIASALRADTSANWVPGCHLLVGFAQGARVERSFHSASRNSRMPPPAPRGRATGGAMDKADVIGIHGASSRLRICAPVKATQLGREAQGLGAAAAAEGADEHEPRRLRVEAPQAHQQARTHHLEGRQRIQAGRGEEREIKRRRPAARSQHAVVNRIMDRVSVSRLMNMLKSRPFKHWGAFRRLPYRRVDAGAVRVEK